MKKLAILVLGVLSLVACTDQKLVKYNTARLDNIEDYLRNHKYVKPSENLDKLIEEGKVEYAEEYVSLEKEAKKWEREKSQQVLLGDVVVHHQVVVRDQHRLQTGPQRPQSFRCVTAATADEDGLRVTDRLTEHLQPGPLQRGPGVHDIGHDIGHPQPDGGFDGTVELDELRRDALPLEPLPQQPRVGGGDPLALQIRDGEGTTLQRGEAEPAATETQPHDLLGTGSRVQQHVETGDADIEVSLTDVDGDVAGTQVVELDVVGLVDEGEVLRVGALPVPGRAEHLGRGLGQGTLVGHGDPEHGGVHGWGLTGGGRRRRDPGRERSSSPGDGRAAG